MPAALRIIGESNAGREPREDHCGSQAEPAQGRNALRRAEEATADHHVRARLALRVLQHRDVVNPVLAVGIECDDEPGPLPAAGAFRYDCTFVRLDQRFGDGEPETQSTQAGPLALLESLENLRERFV